MGSHPVQAAVAVHASDVKKSYGGVTALKGVSFSINTGEVFGIIGPNGAGKSTLFDVLCGIVQPSSGTVEVLGKSLAGMPPHEVSRIGVGRTFQRTAVFGEVSVLENLRYGCHSLMRHSVLGRGLHSRAYRRDCELFEDKARYVLHATGLFDDRGRQASVLAYGVQRRLAVAVALMSDPQLLFLDEPAAGMNGRETAEFIELVRSISHNRTIVIVEHDMSVIKALCGRVLVVVDGRPVCLDEPSQVFRHEEVVAAYLGADDE